MPIKTHLFLLGFRNLIIGTIFISLLPSARANVIQVTSLRELSEYASESGNNIKMEPGKYFLNDLRPIERIPATMPSDFDDWIYIEFSGSNNVFDLTGVTIIVDTGLRSALNPPQHTPEFLISGDKNELRGVKITNVGQGTSRGGSLLSIRGDNNTLREATLYVQGSFPYGYGDLLGKGSNSLVSLRKHSGVQITGSNTRVIGTKLYMRSFGHGFYVQEGAVKTYFEDCYVEGVMRSADDMLAETSGPAYDLNFASVRQNRDGEYKITPGYMKSLAEDGFRTYGGVRDVTFINCVSKNMRGGWELRTSGPIHIENCTSIGNERGFWVGSDAVIHNSRGDAKYGPLLFMEGNDSTVDLEVLADESEMNVHALATIHGDRHNVSITALPEKSRTRPLAIKIAYSQPSAGEGMSPFGERPANHIALKNRTTMPVKLAPGAKNNTISTIGEIIRDEGENNTITTFREGALNTWRMHYFGTIANTGEAADYADPTGSGRPNLLRYFFAESPFSGMRSPLFTRVADTGKDAHLLFTYNRLKAAPMDVAYVILWSNTPQGPWSSEDVNKTVLAEDTLTETVEAAIPVEQAAQRFVTLKAWRRSLFDELRSEERQVRISAISALSSVDSKEAIAFLKEGGDAAVLALSDAILYDDKKAHEVAVSLLRTIGHEFNLTPIDNGEIQARFADFAFPERAEEAEGPVEEIHPGDNIQEAIDRLAGSESAKRGGVVLLRKGKHYITETLIPRSRITLKGEGPGSIITRREDVEITNPSYMVYTAGGVDDLVIRDLTIDGGHRHLQAVEDRATPRLRNLMILDDSGVRNRRVLISGVHIRGASYGLHSKGTDDLIIENCRFYDNGKVMLFDHNLYLRRNERVLIADSMFASSNSGNGINLTRQKDIVVRNNVFFNNFFRGVRAANTQNLVISGNVAVANGSSRSDGAFGIGSRSEDGGISSYIIKNNYATGNQIADFSIRSAQNGVMENNISEDFFPALDGR